MLLSDALPENADAWKITVFPILQSIVIVWMPMGAFAEGLKYGLQCIVGLLL